MDCAIIMSDITDDSSLKHVDDWIELFKRYGRFVCLYIYNLRLQLTPLLMYEN